MLELWRVSADVREGMPSGLVYGMESTAVSGMGEGDDGVRSGGEG